MNALLFNPNEAIEDQAADALLRAMSLYKACGWRRDNMIGTIDNLWGATPTAKPDPAREAVEKVKRDGG